MMTSTYRCPRADFGSGPTMSMPILQNRTSMIGRGIRASRYVTFGLWSWQVAQWRQYSSTAFFTPG